MEKEAMPLVSVCCLVYNHEPFLRECFDGFVMQQTTFPIEILVHDDASTDHSADIIREYTAKYPQLFKPIYQTENQYSKGISISFKFQFPRARGKYIAMCEGDDYWTDPLKLQKQVEFLEKNGDYMLSFHKVIIKSEIEEERSMFSHLEEREYINSEIYNRWTIPTCSVVYRKEKFDYKPSSKIVFGDIYLWLTIMRNGKAYCLDFFGAVYRRHSNGLSFPSGLNHDLAKKLFYQYKYMQCEFPDVANISIRLRNKYLNQLLADKNDRDTLKFRLYKMMYEPKLIFSRFCFETFFRYIPSWIKCVFKC
jgi:glycosyltransferase involved in cell wall biosynthesis